MSERPSSKHYSVIIIPVLLLVIFISALISYSALHPDADTISKEKTAENTAPATAKTPQDKDEQAPYWNNIADPFLTKKVGQYFEVFMGMKDPLGDELSYSLLDSSLPDGVTLNSFGKLSGQTDKPGYYKITVLGMTKREIGTKKELTLVFLNSDGSLPPKPETQDIATDDLPDNAIKITYDDFLNDQKVLTCNKVHQHLPEFTSGALAYPNPKDGAQILHIWCDMEFQGGGWTYVGTKQPSSRPAENKVLGDPSSSKNKVLPAWLWQAYKSDATELRWGNIAIIDLTKLNPDCLALADRLDTPVLALSSETDCGADPSQQILLGGPVDTETGLTQLPTGLYQGKETDPTAIKWLISPLENDHGKFVIGKNPVPLFLR